VSRLKAAIGPAYTPRELSILRWLAEGHECKEIAANLGLAEGYVRQQVHFILRKLGARNRTHAVVLAIRAGLIELEGSTPAEKPNWWGEKAHAKRIAARITFRQVADHLGMSTVEVSDIEFGRLPAPPPDVRRRWWEFLEGQS
jgi:DNA-binding CsgD family transcriptional regulator